MSRKRIGELLLERKLISEEQLEAGLIAQKRTRQRLGITLIQQGLLTEAQLADVLATSLGLPSVDLSKVQVDWSAVHMLRARFCENHEVFPFAIDGRGTATKRLLVAMSDPLNQPALDEVEFTTGLQAAPCVATHSQVREAILRYYHKVAASASTPTPGAGATMRLISSSPDAEDPVVVGEEILSLGNQIPADVKVPTKPATRRKKREVEMSKDLEFLFGLKGDADDVESMERRFWALLRLLQKKGLVTREEFLNELGED
jgi:predicted HTH domain antitoxin